MASGHVNRTNRPNTWLHRPTLQNGKKVLANPEPSTHGTKRNCLAEHGISGAEGRPAVPSTSQRQPPLTSPRGGGSSFRVAS
jgi:hypothetical protein